MASDEATTEGQISVLAEEIAEQKRSFNNQFGWVKMCKDVSDYCNCSLFQVFDRLAVEVLSIAHMMIQESEINQIQSNTKQS